VAYQLFPEVGPAGVAALRFFFAALILWAVARPSLRGIGRKDWLALGCYAASLGVMNSTFYEALARIDMGATVTIEIVGPLVLSVVLARRASAWVWAVAAFIGVALITNPLSGHFNLAGVLFAACAGASWAAYILSARLVGTRFHAVDGLALATALAAIVVVPRGIVHAGSALTHPAVLGLGLVVALASSVVPYGIEMMTLRHLPAEVFSVVLALSPAIASVVGWVALHQALRPLAIVGMAMVIGASTGATLTGKPRRETAP
jgi:inner membrane transporter RhtA